MKSTFRYVWLCLLLLLVAQGRAATLGARAAASGSYTSYPIVLLDELSGFSIADEASDDFTRTGMYRYLRVDSTGFYHVEKIGDRWWLIDPDGYAGINMAVTSIENTRVQDDYDLIRKNGYNGIGNFITTESQTKNAYNSQNMFQFSYSRRVPMHAEYIKTREVPVSITKKENYVFVLDAEFESYVAQLVQTKISPCVSERDLLGWFTDNEIPFNQDQLQLLTRDLPAGDPSREAALEWAAERGLNESDCMNGATSNADKEAFATYLAQTYYTIVERQIRAVDSVHMILGSRLHGRPRAIAGVVAASHAHTDVTSVNFYDKFCPDDQIADPAWTQDHPCLVGEFYIKDANFYNGTQAGAGWYVNGQEDRGRWYQNTCLQLLQSKCFIGWHYFRFMDDGTSNKGMVNANREEYTEMTNYMRQLNLHVYRLIEYFDHTQYAPQTSVSKGVFAPAADTYTILGSTQTDNYGAEPVLQVMNNLYQKNRKEAFIRFDLSSIDSLLPYLKHAELQLTCAETDLLAHNLFVSGIENTDWQEHTLCGAIAYESEALKTTFNRLDTYKEPFHEGEVYRFDVSQWLLMGYPPSFKVHATEKTETPVCFHSREAHTVSPRLCITLWGDHSLPAGIADNSADGSASPSAVKRLENGIVIITRGEGKYNLLGIAVDNLR